MCTNQRASLKNETVSLAIDAAVACLSEGTFLVRGPISESESHERVFFIVVFGTRYIPDSTCILIEHRSGDDKHGGKAVLCIFEMRIGARSRTLGFGWGQGDEI